MYIYLLPANYYIVVSQKYIKRNSSITSNNATNYFLDSKWLYVYLPMFHFLFDSKHHIENKL